MKAKHIFSTLILWTLGLAACNNEGVVPTDNPEVHRTVVYCVGNHETSTNLKSDSEWDALLDQFCSYAMAGEPVAFYSISSAPMQSHAMKGCTKEKNTITTKSRDELKAWMKDMEKQGKTVNVNYDEKTGVWSGVAYAGVGNQTITEGQRHTGTLSMAPAPNLEGIDENTDAWVLKTDNDSILYLALGGHLLFSSDITTIDFGYSIDETTLSLYGTVSSHTDLSGNEYLVLDLSVVDASTVAGTWQLMELSKLVVDPDNRYGDISMYWWDNEGVPVYYSLESNGNATMTQGSNTEHGTWNMSADGDLCCDLFEGGACWNINWYSSETLILSHEDYSDTEGLLFYQMILSATN